jgi:hypothetical protein
MVLVRHFSPPRLPATSDCLGSRAKAQLYQSSMPETPIRFRPVLQFFAALVRITVQDLGHAPFEPLRSLRIVAPPKVRRQPMQLIGRDEEDGMAVWRACNAWRRPKSKTAERTRQTWRLIRNGYRRAGAAILRGNLLRPRARIPGQLPAHAGARRARRPLRRKRSVKTPGQAAARSVSAGFQCQGSSSAICRAG